MDGILNVDKPYGLTSMDVVRRLKRASGVKRVGHGGTLDPIATGVIPICFGQATRLMEYLVDGTKDYRAVVELGVETDTYDALGQVVSNQNASHVTLADVSDALESYTGVIQQVPPMYSALKQQGKRLYDLARAGIEVAREPRTVEVFEITVLDWSPPQVTLEATCGRGFYVRSLAHDLGSSLGCGGHLKSLTRLRSGPFKVADALSVSDAEEILAGNGRREYLHAPDAVLRNMRAAVVGRHAEELIKHGRRLPATLGFPQSDPSENCRVYSTDGRFIGIVTFDASSGQWRPDKVFSLSYPEPEDI